MNDAPRVNAAATAGWPDLVDELDRWEKAGRVAGLWWRDDDAVTATLQLERLLSLADGVPIALAVIPALARREFAAALSDVTRLSVLQHGWQHANHAPNGKKSEYPTGRSASAVAAELGAGHARLKALFGERALPILAPPWNRIAEEFLPLLADGGIEGLSVMAPRRVASPPDLVALDVDLDLVDWHGDRGFIGEAIALGGLLRQLRARWRAQQDPLPIGLLTHHLVMDERTAAFLKRLVELTRGHNAVHWMAAGEFLQ